MAFPRVASRQEPVIAYYWLDASTFQCRIQLSPGKLGRGDVEKRVQGEHDLVAEYILHMRLGAPPRRYGVAQFGLSFFGDENAAHAVIARIQVISHKSLISERFEVTTESRRVHSHALGQGAYGQAGSAAHAGPEELCQQAKLIDGKADRFQRPIIKSGQLAGRAARPPGYRWDWPWFLPI